MPRDPQPPFLFRVVCGIFLAVSTLFAMRLVFAAARRMNRVDSGERGGQADRAVGGKPGRGSVAGGSGRPRIDRTAAEDVPFIEVQPENARRG